MYITTSYLNTWTGRNWAEYHGGQPGSHLQAAVNEQVNYLFRIGQTGGRLGETRGKQQSGSQASGFGIVTYLHINRPT